MIDFTTDIFNGRYGSSQKNAEPKLVEELQQAAKECSGFAVMTSQGPKLTQHVNILDEHNPRARAFSRLQWLHLKASGICDEI